FMRHGGIDRAPYVLDMDTIEDLAAFHDALRGPGLEIDERIAAGAVDSGKPQDINLFVMLLADRGPGFLGLKARQRTLRGGRRGHGFVDPFAVPVAIDADGRKIDDSLLAPERGDAV